MPEPFAANLRRFRKARGMTLRALAEKAGVSGPAVARMESGASKPSLDVLVRLARALGCTSDELLGLDGPSRPC